MHIIFCKDIKILIVHIFAATEYEYMEYFGRVSKLWGQQ